VATAYDEQRGGTRAAANFFDGVAPFPIAATGDKDARLQANGYVNGSDADSRQAPIRPRRKRTDHLN